MDAVELGQPPIRVSATGDFAPTPTTPVRRGDDAVSVGHFAGLTWTYRAGFDALLREVPPDHWANPAATGWTRIKHNARREVWQARIDGNLFYLKYFFRHPLIPTIEPLLRMLPCQKEWEGGLFALRAGIAAVRPVGYTIRVVRDGRPCSLLVTEGVEPAFPLNDFWLQLASDEDEPRRRRDTQQLVELLGELIARAHQAGFQHLDMHAENILVQPIGPRRYRALLVDLQSARRGADVSDRSIVENLAQLNQWFRKHSSTADRLRFLRAYLRARDRFEPLYEHGRPLGLGFAALVRELVRAAEAQANRIWAQRDRRTARNNRYFKRVRLADGWRGLTMSSCKHATEHSAASRLVFSREWWLGVLREPLRWFAPEQAGSCKSSHSAIVRRAVLQHPDGQIPAIVKRPLARNWRRRLAQLFGASRSLRGWRMGYALLNRDLPVARPMAVLERRIGPLRLDSLLVMEAIPGGQDLESHVKSEFLKREAGDWLRHKRALGARLVCEVRRLQERGFAHRDCKASNLLVLDLPAGPRLLWIDMDGLRRKAKLTRRDLLRPLMRLHVSLDGAPGLTRTDRVRFLKAYCARFGTRPDAWRDAWREIEAEVAQKSAARAARRAWKLKHYGRT